MRIFQFLFISCFLISCHDECLYNTFREEYCINEDIEFRSFGQSCENIPETSCSIIEKPWINYISDEKLRWLPNWCLATGESISFKHESLISNFKIVKKEHFIFKSVLFKDCPQDETEAISICQNNESMTIMFLADEFGPDTIKLSLSNHLLEIDAEKGDQIEFLQLIQREKSNNSGIFGMSYYFTLFMQEQRESYYHPSITLNGKSYTSVIELKHFRPNEDIPHLKFFFKKQIGILGFQKDDKIWLYDD